MNPRAVAANCLHQVIYQGRSLTEVLQTESILKLEDSDRALAKDLCFGSLRWHYHIDYMLSKLLAKPLKNRDKDVECLLRVGLYQLQYQNTAEYAAVNETVKASKGLKKPWSKGLINGVLRGYLRRKDKIAEKIESQPAYPKWLVKHIKKAWPEKWKKILKASNKRAPMTLRVNASQTTVDDYIKLLDGESIEAKKHPLVDSAIELIKPVNVYQLPDFASGMVSVQDASAQLAAVLLDCQSGMKVLDACAAPGGKTGHIAERSDGLDITAIDNVPERLAKVEENITRLGKQVRLVEADANKLKDWHDGVLFDRILLDAPCSALGVMRRHPDIKILRKEKDVESLVVQQQNLLESLWSILKPGGKLLYATCSILPAENEEQIARFMERHIHDADVLSIKADWGIACQYGRQILPGKDNMDGFYYSLLQKQK